MLALFWFRVVLALSEVGVAVWHPTPLQIPGLCAACRIDVLLCLFLTTEAKGKFSLVSSDEGVLQQ